MSNSVQMPALGESVTEGTVTRWLKQVGDRVEVDEPLLEVSTDKVDTEIPSPVAGIVEQILVGEDETVEIGTPLVLIAGEGEGRPQQPVQQDASASEWEQEPATSDSGRAPAPQASETQASEGQTSEGQPAPSREEPAPASSASPADGSQEHRVAMPALGESVTEGTVTRWLKREGEQVEVDEPLLEVSTDKVDTEIPSPVAGVLTRILVGEDQTAAVGADLAVVSSGAVTDAPAGAPAAAAPAQVSSPEPTPAPAAVRQQEPVEEPTAGVPAPSGPVSEGTGTAHGSAPAAGQERSSDADQVASLWSTSPATPAQGRVGEPGSPERVRAAQAGGDGSVYVTPLVRRLAAQHDVDLAEVQGTGVGGRVRKQDVLEAARVQAERAEAARREAERVEAARHRAPAAAAAPSSPAPAAVSPLRGTREKMTRLRKVIATRMVESLQVSAQLTTVVEVDITRVARLRQRAKADFEAREGVRLTYLPFFALAAVEALKQFPVLNASIDGEEIVYHGEENLSIAVDTDRGLVVPVIHSAGDLNIAGLARKIADLADRTRRNKITPDDIKGGTFTLTNTGSRGALFDTPIINQPQVAILGTGAVVRKPVVITDADGADTIAIRSMVHLALSYDHRLVDGADAARFLGAVKTRLQDGAFEADLGL